MLPGEVLSRGVQDVQAGYVNFANAVAMWLFGDNLLSLRHPHLIMIIVQSCLIYSLQAPSRCHRCHSRLSGHGFPIICAVFKPDHQLVCPVHFCGHYLMPGMGTQRHARTT